MDIDPDVAYQKIASAVIKQAVKDLHERCVSRATIRRWVRSDNFRLWCEWLRVEPEELAERITSEGGRQGDGETT